MSKNKEDIKNKIENDPDFIWSPKHGFSVDKLTKKYDNGIDNLRISKVLLISEEQVETIFQKALKNLRKIMNVNSDTE